VIDHNNTPPPADEVGPQKAAEQVLEVNAEPFDASSEGPNGEPTRDPVNEWRDTLIFAVGISTDMLALRWPPMATSDQERAQLADTWAPLLAKWFPETIPPELLALATTAVIFAPKIMASAALAKEKKTPEPNGPPSSAPRATGEAPRDRGTIYPDRIEPQPS
jgi:hypothetical protein